MKAIVQDKYGSPDDVLQLREIDTPVIGDDEVLVRVRAASVHPDVWHVVTGRPYVLRLMGAGVLRPKNPVPGTDVAGLVESVGKDVTRFRPGDEVFSETHTKLQWRNGGAFAEYVSVPQDALALKRELTQGSILALQAYDWPGNVRELMNVIERAVITSRSGAIRFDLPRPNSGKVRRTDSMPTTPSTTVLPDAVMKRRERENILAALDQTDWRVHGPGGAAELLGVRPTTLTSRIKRMGLTKPA